MASLTLDPEDNSSLSLEDIVAQEHELLNKILHLTQYFDENFVEKWQNKQFIEAIDDAHGTIEKNTMSLDTLMGLHFKSLRLSQRYTEKQVEMQKLLLENLEIFNGVRYDFRATKALGTKNQSPFSNTHTVSIPLPKIVTLFNRRIKTYIEYQKKLMELWEIENNLFTTLINNVHSYMNSGLKLMTLVIKALYIHREIQMYMEQKNNFNDDQLLKKTQRLYKYMDNIFRTMDQMEENLYKIKTLTGQNLSHQLFWDLQDKSSVFWEGNLNKSLQDKIIETKTFSTTFFNKFSQGILKKKLNHSMKKSKTFLVIYKIFQAIAIEKGNMTNLMKKKKFNNHWINLLENFVEVDLDYTYKWNPKEKKYTSNDGLKISVRLRNIINGIMTFMIDQYQFNQDLIDINDKSRNLYGQISQLMAQKQLSQYKMEALEKKRNFYRQRLEENAIKATVLLSEYASLQEEIKSRLLKYFKREMEANEQKKNIILTNFLLANIHVKSNIHQKKSKKTIKIIEKAHKKTIKIIEKAHKKPIKNTTA
jgi:hypothetical protein